MSTTPPPAITVSKQINVSTRDKDFGFQPDITIENLVVTFSLSCRIDLKNVASKAPNTEYNPKRFAAVVMRIRSPKTTALLFSSGKAIVAGARSLADAARAARKYARAVQKLDYPVRFRDFCVQNMVASTDLSFSVGLESLAHENNKFCSYEPELFPGLVYRMKEPKVVINVFVSGKVVVTGGKSLEQVREALAKLYPIAAKYRKKAQSAEPLVDIDDLAF